MNKKELEEVLKIMNEPITVNSIDYKYFTQEQYNRLISVYDNAKWLVDYALTQSRFIDNLNERIDKAIEYIENNPLYEKEYDYDYDDNLELSNISDSEAKEDLLNILRGNYE